VSAFWLRLLSMTMRIGRDGKQRVIALLKMRS